MKYLLHGKLIAKPEQGAALSSLLLKTSEMMQEVQGCILYAISRDPADPEAVWITEIWENKEDHDQSLHLENVQASIRQAMPLIGAAPQRGQELEALGGLGL